MKLKNILACVLGAGLLTVATGNARATVIDNNLVIPLKAQLIIKWTDSNGKIKMARISSKDMVDAISEDFGVNFSGDQIVYWLETGEYYLMDKNDVLVENLSADQVIIAISTIDSENNNDGNNGKFKDVEIGTIDLEFYSDGDLGGVAVVGTSNSADSTLWFNDDIAPFTFTETGSVFKNGKQTITWTGKVGVGAVGHDFDVIADDNLPVFGTLNSSGSGKVIPAV
jgi:hypothetical protein